MTQLRKSYFSLLLVLSMLFAHSAIAQPYSAERLSELNQDIEKLINEFDENINIGIKIEDVKHDVTLYQRNADRSFIPASNQKIFTAIAALLYLGPEFKYQTRVLTDDDLVENGVLTGDLYLQFSGAPDLTVGNLDKMIEELEHRGIKRIKGFVYVDNSAFDDVKMGPGWMWDDALHCFSAPIQSSIINKNCVALKVVPGKKTGSPAKIVPMLRNKAVKFNNKAVTRYKKKKCYLQLKPTENNSYQLKGCILSKSKGLGMSIALHDPEAYSELMLASLLKKHKIRYPGKIKQGRAQSNYKVLAETNSQPVEDLITEQLKESDNIISEALFKKIAQRYHHSPGSWKNGEQAVKAILEKKAKIDFTNSVIADGSGLSRYNLVTPNQVIQLLDFAYQHFPISSEFISALPVSGTDGTLQYRMTEESPARSKVRAKTGAMAGVSSLSGYINTNNNRTLGFSILINGITGPVSEYRDLEDKICEYLVKNL